MNKIAICFSGQIRDIDKSFSYWKDIIDKYEMDVYGSFWETDDYSKNTFENLNPINVEYEKYDSFKSTIEVFNRELNVPEYPQVNLGLTNDTTDYVKKNNIISMWYKVWRANLMTKGQNYDIVIRARTDIYFDDLEIEKNENLNIPWGWRMNTAWLNCGGPIDMFAYGSSKVMDYYSCLFLYLSRFLKEGQYFFPAEHVLKSHLSQSDIIVKTLPIRLFLFRDDSCFNQSWGVSESQLIDSKNWSCELDPNFSFYKKIERK